MIACKDFLTILQEQDICFFAGVPDSLLKYFNAYILDHVDASHHIIAANEGGAVGLAAGYHLSTGKFPLVYMQNSGMGNAVNPLVSLTDPEVYNIPMLLLVGWRGKPGIQDEPQHKKQGMITPHLLDTLGIQYKVLGTSLEEIRHDIATACRVMSESKRVYALLVEKETFESYAQQVKKSEYELTRGEVITSLMEQLDEESLVVSTTGYISREIYQYRKTHNQPHDGDFLTVGSMGHVSQIALGIALYKPEKKIICLDGDGSAIMHLGAFAINGGSAPPNFKHILLNNGSHESVGGQPTRGFSIDFVKIAQACGYESAFRITNQDELISSLAEYLHSPGSRFLEIRIRMSKADLVRPTEELTELKESFMKKNL